jgi:hypothetical protein
MAHFLPPETREFRVHNLDFVLETILPLSQQFVSLREHVLGMEHVSLEHPSTDRVSPNDREFQSYCLFIDSSLRFQHERGGSGQIHCVELMLGPEPVCVHFRSHCQWQWLCRIVQVFLHALGGNGVGCRCWLFCSAIIIIIVRA